MEDIVEQELMAHEAYDAQRFAELEQEIQTIKKEKYMDSDSMGGLGGLAALAALAKPTGMGTGGALGATGAVLGGLGLLSNLGRNGGLFGGNGSDGVGAAALVANSDERVASLERLVTSRFDAEAQRDIEAAIERTAAANLLAISTGNAALGVEMAKGQGETNTQVALTTGALGTQNALNAAALGVQVQKTAGDLATQVAATTGALGTQNALNASALGVAVEKASGDISTLIAQQGSAIGVAIERAATANALSQKDMQMANSMNFAQGQLTAMQNANVAAAQLAATQYTLANAIKTDGDLTRGLIISNNDAELNRRLVIQANEITELRGDRNHRDRSRETELNITQSVVTNQNQLQSQQQQQQQAVFNAQMLATMQNLQIATATNANLIIGNSGVTAAGPQTASPVNVRA